MPKKTKIGIVGAGLSALTAALELQKSGHEVQVVEKSQHSGGRMATKIMGKNSFDHGAQYFTARNSAFKRKVKSWKEEGVAKEWKGTIGEIKNNRFKPCTKPLQRFVGVPSMRAISCHLEKQLCVSYGNTVTSTKYQDAMWYLVGEDFNVACDILIISTPPQQALPLLPSGTKLTDIVKNVHFEPCWSVMITFPHYLDISFDAAFVNEGPISWIARNSSKPNRDEIESWVLHATSKWSIDFFDRSSEEVTEILLDCFRTITGQEKTDPNFANAHRWRYSTCNSPLNCGSLWDPDFRIGLCGDWCDSLRVEGAFMSGINLAKKITDTNGLN